MKAIIRDVYGSPDVLSMQEVPRPIPTDGQVLVRIHAASVNALDWHHLRGTPKLMRIALGLSKPNIRILGADLAGIVEEVGHNVKNFKTGDQVFGYPKELGSFAEYATVSEEGLVPKPANITFEEAAAIPVAALTALQALRDTAKVRAGEHVLINGAGGGVGTFSVQIAKALGAKVTAVCSLQNKEMAARIGADEVIDYAKEDFTLRRGSFDLIIDNVGNKTVAEHRRALKTGGRCVIVGYTRPGLLMQHMIWGPLSSRGGAKRVGPMPVAHGNKKDLMTLRDMAESGKIKPVIDREYALDKTAEAIRYVELGHARGKVVIRVV